MHRAHRYDVLVVGAGGAGLMAARYAAQNPNVSVAVISKLYPTRSHTGAAQGGVGAARGEAFLRVFEAAHRRHVRTPVARSTP